ncbi:MAG: hypothetical protein B0D92_03495 [Spirochaeta sp. LUC14_002_19_P3]|nr:MAG: hypothetical protein B0D92_03495 [Spirochaeta sp. LUC14_002_19_P3]
MLMGVYYTIQLLCSSGTAGFPLRRKNGHRQSMETNPLSEKSPQNIKISIFFQNFEFSEGLSPSYYIRRP